MDDLDIAAGLLFFTVALAVLNGRRKRNANGMRRWWVHPINELRQDEGAWTVLMERFRNEFPEKHQATIRLSKENFDKILQHVRPVIEKQDTQFRDAIPAQQRLCVTLYFLATGDSIHSLHLFFRMGQSTIRDIIYETSQAIWDTMGPLYMKTPSSPQEWKKIATDFSTYWDFPNCLGAIDGKHCNIQAPKNSGSEFFNYKKTFSIVLMAVCDAHYRFVYVDVGTPGRWSDGGTFDTCSLSTKMSEGGLNLPTNSQLPSEIFCT